MIDFRCGYQYLLKVTSGFREWLLDYRDILWKVIKNLPEGEIKDKNWVDNEEWSKNNKEL